MIDIHLKYDKTWKVKKMTKTEELELARQTIKNKDEIIARLYKDQEHLRNMHTGLQRMLGQVHLFGKIIENASKGIDDIITKPAF